MRQQNLFSSFLSRRGTLNMGENALDKIDSQGKITRVLQDDRLIWADGLSIAPNGWMYMGVNQLNRSPLFNSGKEQGKAPYLILRIWTGIS
jgi:hypothetical protein